MAFFHQGIVKYRILYIFIHVFQLGILLLKIGSPIYNGRYCSLKLVQIVMEAAIHVTVLVASLAFTVMEEFLFDHSTYICSHHDCKSNQHYFDGTIVIYVVISLLLFILVFCVIFLLYFYVKFFKTRIITKIKCVVLKVFVLLTFLVTDFAFEISFYWTDRLDEYTNRVVGTFTINSSFLELVFLVSLMAMFYLPRSRCCKKSKNNFDRAPLLTNSRIQCTNPESLWDHDSVPSYTVYDPPPEMSDCVT